MAVASQPSSAVGSSLQEQARRHLWMHFSRMGSYSDEHEIPVIVRGDGCYVYDEHGNRYLDGLSALFCVNAGHGRPELADAAAAQIRELNFFTTWSYAHPRAITLCFWPLPCIRWKLRASFSADSTASEPPLVKKTRLRSAGASEASFVASSIARGWA